MRANHCRSFPHHPIQLPLCSPRKYWQAANDKQRDASKRRGALALEWCLMRESGGFAVLQDEEDQ